MRTGFKGLSVSFGTWRQRFHSQSIHEIISKIMSCEVCLQRWTILIRSDLRNVHAVARILQVLPVVFSPLEEAARYFCGCDFAPMEIRLKNIYSLGLHLCQKENVETFNLTIDPSGSFNFLCPCTEEFDGGLFAKIGIVTYWTTQIMTCIAGKCQNSLFTATSSFRDHMKSLAVVFFGCGGDRPDLLPHRFLDCLLAACTYWNCVLNNSTCCGGTCCSFRFVALSFSFPNCFCGFEGLLFKFLVALLIFQKGGSVLTNTELENTTFSDTLDLRALNREKCFCTYIYLQ